MTRRWKDQRPTQPTSRAEPIAKAMAELFGLTLRHRENCLAHLKAAGL